MCLVDDLMEPFRPLTEYQVARLIANGASDVASTTKGILARVLSLDMVTPQETTPWRCPSL